MGKCSGKVFLDHLQKAAGGLAQIGILAGDGLQGPLRVPGHTEQLNALRLRAAQVAGNQRNAQSGGGQGQGRGGSGALQQNLRGVSGLLKQTIHIFTQAAAGLRQGKNGPPEKAEVQNWEAPFLGAGKGTGGVPGGQRQQQFFLSDGQIVVIGALARVQGDKAQVQRALGNGLLLAAGIQFLNAESDLGRFAPEGRPNGRQQRAAPLRVKANGQAARSGSAMSCRRW